MFRFYYLFILSLLLAGISAQAQRVPVRERLSLAGSWMLKMDPSVRGLPEHWQDSTFVEEVLLPGTLEENGIGEKVEKTTTDHLNQTYAYTGAALFTTGWCRSLKNTTEGGCMPGGLTPFTQIPHPAITTISG